MTFGVWLRCQPPGDPDLDRLQEFAGGRSTLAWPYHSSDFGLYAAAVGTEPDEARRTALLDALGRGYQQWLVAETRAGPDAPDGWRMLLRARPGMVLLSLFGLVIAAALLTGIFRSDFLQSLGADGQARGLITFLFAMSTIAVVLLAAVAVFWVGQEELKERFGYAKDLVTILIGVLGTIMGFYFGTAATEPAQADSPTVVVTGTALPLGNTASPATPD